MKWLAAFFALLIKYMAVLCALLLGVYLALGLIWPAYTHSYRLTLTFEVNGRLASGSSVLQTHFQTGPSLGSAPLGKVSLTGEAIFVDLGPDGHIISILAHGILPRAQGPNIISTGEYNNLALEAFGMYSCSGDHCAHKAIAHASGTRELAADRIPMLVYFDDLNDPATLKYVQSDRPRSSLGTSLELRNATVEITRDAITWHLHRRLPWIGDETAERNATAALELQYRSERGALSGTSVFRRR